MSDSPASTALEIRSTRSLFSTFRFDSLSCVPQPLHPRFSRNQECWNKSDLIVFSWFCEPYRDAIPSPVRRAKRSKMFFERKLVWIRLFDDLLWEGETSMRQRTRARNKTSDWQSSYRSECDLLQNEMIFTDDWLEGFGLIYSKSDRQNQWLGALWDAGGRFQTSSVPYNIVTGHCGSFGALWLSQMRSSQKLVHKISKL